MPNSVHGDILAAVKTAVEGLSLSGVNAVYIRKFPYLRDGLQTLPAVIVSPLTETFPLTGSNSADDTVFGVQVSAARASNHGLDLAANDALLIWREAIRKAFREKRITGIAGSYRTTVEGGPIIDPIAFADQLDATTLFIRCQVRENRN